MTELFLDKRDMPAVEDIEFHDYKEKQHYFKERAEKFKVIHQSNKWFRLDELGRKYLVGAGITYKKEVN